jgi:hypothetical protein
MTKTSNARNQARKGHEIDRAAARWQAAKEAADQAAAELKAARAALEALVPAGTAFPAHVPMTWSAAERLVVIDQEAFEAGAPAAARKTVLDTAGARAWEKVTGEKVPGLGFQTVWNLRWL